MLGLGAPPWSRGTALLLSAPVLSICSSLFYLSGVVKTCAASVGGLKVFCPFLSRPVRIFLLFCVVWFPISKDFVLTLFKLGSIGRWVQVNIG